MARKAKMKFEIDEERELVIIQIEILSEDSMDRDASFVLSHHARVLDQDPVHNQEVLFRKNFRTTDRTIRFSVPTSKLKGYCYNGSKIELEYLAELKIDDAVFFDTKVSKEIIYKVLKKPKLGRSANRLIYPKDHYNLLTNLRALPMKNQIATLGLLVVGLIVIAINTIIGLHDQMSPESQTFLYSHRDSDGDSSSPLANSLIGSGAAGAAIWFAMRRHLRKYMTFNLHRLPSKIDRSTRLPINRLIYGKSRVDLNNVALRVVACNLEKGEYMRGSGSDRRTVSFSKPVHGVMLYEHKVKKVAKNTPVENCFPGEVEFKDMFEGLYPTIRISSTHGLFVYWEVQLLVDDLIDQELIGSTDPMSPKDFFDGEL